MAPHDRIWAPWRIGYVTGSESSANQSDLPDLVRWQDGADSDCFLCRSAAQYANQDEADRHHLIARRGHQTFVILNRFPYNNGHLLVSPLRHVPQLHDLTPEEHLECLDFIGEMIRLLTDRLGAQGFNVGLNLGHVAGAGVPGHLHWHLVPRWQGDHNFMPILAGVQMIPQSLDALWDLLKDK
jgi:ATP adenylyltransferase